MSDTQGEHAPRSGNVARYFVEHAHVGWVLLIALVVGGVLAYQGMPKRKDPEIPVRVAVAAVGWPGARAELVEEAITRRLEAKIAENEHVDKIESTTRTGVSIVRVTLTSDIENTGREFDDISARIDTIHDWPVGAYPPQFIKDFGSTVALMLTVASPPMPELEASLRARGVRDQLAASLGASARPDRRTIVFAHPSSIDAARLRPIVERVRGVLAQRHVVADARVLEGDGFVALDVASTTAVDALDAETGRALRDVLPEGERHPDLWQPFVVAGVDEVERAFSRVVGPRYSFRELDGFTERLQHRLQRVPCVSKVARVGLQPEQITLDYSQERLASAGVGVEAVAAALATRNVNLPGGIVDVDGRNVPIRTNGEILDDREIREVLVTTTAGGAPVRVGDLFDVGREYQAPRLLNTYSSPGEAGALHTARAITLAVSMRSGSQVTEFGVNVDRALADVERLLPPDLVVARTSDQPQQVAENIALFNKSLYEAIVLVVAIVLVGFMSWRTAAMLALCIPITLALTYIVMRVIGWDLQQISVSTMILALGLLVDMPVVAADAIVAGLSRGESRTEAAWRGPTRLSVAILFATLTNVVAYLPFLAVPDDIGRFIRSLPVVMTISLLAAWALSLTIVPMVGAALLRAPKRLAPTLAERRQRGFGRVYSRVATWTLRHRAVVLVGSFVLTLASIPAVAQLKTAFFPKDLSYLSYVDIWAPEDATVSETRHLAERAAGVLNGALEDWGKAHPDADGRPRHVLKSMTTFVGGGGPRFWFSVVPEQQQTNYAQIIVQVLDKRDTTEVVDVMQRALDGIGGARMDVRQLEMAKPVGIPVQVRVMGEDIPALREQADRLRRVFEAVPLAERVRDDWGTEALSMNLVIDADRAAVAGVTHQDVAFSSAASYGGRVIGALRDADKTVPVVARLRATERVGLSDLDNLYVSAARTGQRVPIAQVADARLAMAVEKIQRRNHERTITVACFPAAGHLPSEVMKAARPGIDRLRAGLPPGFAIEVGGEEEEQVKGFGHLTAVLAISIAAIFIALTVQFKNAIKPLVVFTTIPLGVVGALVSLRLADRPFGFMAFLGIISLVGVIVSHVIVLFDFIEERREAGAALEDALIDAGIQRLRPVMITVVATVVGLLPLAMHGGPLWEPLCYAQIGGLSVATVVTLVIVPAVYTTFVRDLRILKW